MVTVTVTHKTVTRPWAAVTIQRFISLVVGVLFAKPCAHDAFMFNDFVRGEVCGFPLFALAGFAVTILGRHVADKCYTLMKIILCDVTSVTFYCAL